MTVKDYLTAPVVVVRPDASFQEMAATLHKYRAAAPRSRTVQGLACGRDARAAQ
jgi:hypothetical protein